MEVNVNGIPHQALHPVNGPQEPFYTQVYKWFPGKTYQNVLVVGAGSGTDVAIALAHGAGHVDAVEIDPAILQIGVENHPDHPYQDPRVTQINNDGRAYLRTTDKKYDLVIFALPDSLTLVSSTANVRLESFLFTQQAFESVRDHLLRTASSCSTTTTARPGWWPSSMRCSPRHSGPRRCSTRTPASRPRWPTAPPWRLSTAPRRPATRSRRCLPPVIRPPRRRPTTGRSSTCAPRSSSRYYLGALGFVLRAGAPGGRLRRSTDRHDHPPLQPPLLRPGRGVPAAGDAQPGELQPAVRDDLAGQRAGLLRHPRQRPAGDPHQPRWHLRRPSLLYARCSPRWRWPTSSRPSRCCWTRLAALPARGGVAFAPVFFANLVFSYSFRDTGTADMAFASNLLGAMVGGAMEYLALITGYQVLLLFVAALYGLAWLFANRWRFLSDVDLAGEAGSGPVGAGGRRRDRAGGAVSFGSGRARAGCAWPRAGPARAAGGASVWPGRSRRSPGAAGHDGPPDPGLLPALPPAGLSVLVAILVTSAHRPDQPVPAQAAHRRRLHRRPLPEPEPVRRA